jgi:hypothetical protein
MLAGGVSLHFAVHPKLETLTKSRYLKTDREKIPVITVGCKKKRETKIFLM